MTTKFTLDTTRSLRVHQNNGVAKNFNHFIRTNCRSRCSSAQRCHGRLRQLRLYTLSSYLELKQELRSISGLLCGLRIMCNFCRLGEWDCEGEVTDSAEKDPGVASQIPAGGGPGFTYLTGVWPGCVIFKVTFYVQVPAIPGYPGAGLPIDYALQYSTF